MTKKSYEPQKLTLKGIKSAARKFYSARKLAAQQRDGINRRCLYSGENGCRCAIGAGLSPSTINEIDARAMNAGTGISFLEYRGIIKMIPSEKSPIQEIQMAHDRWALADRSDPKHVMQAKKKFLAMIGAS